MVLILPVDASIAARIALLHSGWSFLLPGSGQIWADGKVPSPGDQGEFRKRA